MNKANIFIDSSWIKVDKAYIYTSNNWEVLFPTEGGTVDIPDPQEGVPYSLLFTSILDFQEDVSTTIIISVVDYQGNLVSNATNSVSISIHTNPSSGTLSGNTTINAVDGIATFNNISINNSGEGYILIAESNNLISVQSNEFNVTETPQIPGDPPTPPTGWYLLATDQERAIWRRRAGLDSGGPVMYKSYGDVQTNSPGDWDRYLAKANAFRSNPESSRYRNYYTGPGLWPRSASLENIGSFQTPIGIATNCHKLEPRPSSFSGGIDTSADGLVAAAFIYYMTGDESYATPVRNELLGYATNPWLNMSDRNRWAVDSSGLRDVNPGFFIMLWATKMLFSYDFIKNSSSLTTSDRDIIDSWFKNCADYALLTHRHMLGATLGYPLPGRLNDNYTVAKFLAETVIGRYYSGSEPIYNLCGYYNNRIFQHILMYFTYGVKYNSSLHINDGIRTFKEMIAYSSRGGTNNDGTCTEFYRSGNGAPETGYHYVFSSLTIMSVMAAIYARRYSTELYDYSINQAEFNKFFATNTDRSWYSTISATNKNFKKMVENYLRHVIPPGTANTIHNPQRTWNGQIIDGYNPETNPPTDFVSDIIGAISNVYYQEPLIKNIYTRNSSALPNIRQYGQQEIMQNFGSWVNYWDLHGSLIPCYMLRFGQMEGLVSPYV